MLNMLNYKIILLLSITYHIFSVSVVVAEQLR